MECFFLCHNRECSCCVFDVAVPALLPAQPLYPVTCACVSNRQATTHHTHTTPPMTEGVAQLIDEGSQLVGGALRGARLACWRLGLVVGVRAQQMKCCAEPPKMVSA